MLQVAERTDAERAQEIRRRLWNPPNAKSDPGLMLAHPRGVTGWEQEKIKREIRANKKAATEAEKQDKLQKQIEIIAATPIPTGHDWLIVSSREAREGQFPPEMFNVIFKTVCEHFKVKKSDIIGRRRTVNFVRPRHLIIWFARKFTHKSYPQIMRKIGDRDHTSGVNAVDKINTLVVNDPNVREVVDKLNAVFERKVIEWRAEIGTL